MNYIYGTKYDTGSSETILGSSSDDAIDTLGGNDVIIGGSGIDTLLIPDTANNYTIGTINGVTHLTGSKSATKQYQNTTNVLVGVEYIRFSDGTIGVSTKTSGNDFTLATPVLTDTTLTSTSSSTDSNQYYISTVSSAGDWAISGKGVWSFSGSDVLDLNSDFGTSKNDAIANAGRGIDYILIFDNAKNYTISVSGNTGTITALNTAATAYKQKVFHTSDIEYVQFLDGPVALSPITNTDQIYIAKEIDESITGGPGLDSVYFRHNANYYTITGGSSDARAASGFYGVHNLSNIERLIFSDKTIAFDISGTAGQIYRLYKAAFGRTPDDTGLSYWIKAADNGLSLYSAASFFQTSTEFQTKYGLNPSFDQFISAMYTNVLSRSPDQAGKDYWLSQLNSGAVDRASLLTYFSESVENQANVIGSISSGIPFTG